MFAKSIQRPHWARWMVAGALLVGLGCRGPGDELKREAPPPPPPDASSEAKVSPELPQVEDAGAPVCPPRQYQCCDGSCSENKRCPGIACDPRPVPPTFKE
ncbi:hypothetical protein [Myxococcus qinghaiensis]|uniref:hypothetical protein n=1 Tax=Myxococcus qinghaiensis TaxID=2906758 RepID=UPI0020A7D4A4|nr:hypothetical protein [Myxococcus qinghaiensis]MCP3161427.1 hypothetical protein [Myxococcus qinghaiensis]